MLRFAPCLSLAFVLGLGFVSAAAADVVLHGRDAVEVDSGTRDESLWLTMEQLQSLSGFVLKPEGLCRDEICVPVSKGPGARLVRSTEAETRVDLAGLARRLRQPYAFDADARVWSFGPVPVERRAFLEEAIAPDFELADRENRRHRLSDFRGKKVVLVVWASWCACREDLPVWEQLYQELRGRGLEIIAIAEDAEGFRAALPHVDAANATYTSLVDPSHSVTADYDLVNVPTAIWIDEQGVIVRLDDGAYPEQRTILGVDVGVAGYADALRDWVQRGADSPFALTPEQLTAARADPNEQAGIADQEFRLGAYFHARGDAGRATQHWERAAELAPDNWSYRRQEWADSKFESTVKFLARAFSRGLRGVSYYEPITLAKPDVAPAPAERSEPAEAKPAPGASATEPAPVTR